MLYIVPFNEKKIVFSFTNIKGNQREIKQIDGFVGNSNFKSTYLGEFFMDFKKFYIFEEEIIPSRVFFLRNRVCWPWRETL